MTDTAGGRPIDILSSQAIEALQAIARRVEVARRLESGAGEAVLRSIVDATVALFQAEAASIALYDPGSDRLVFRVAAGEHGQGVIGRSVPSGEGLVGYVYTTGQALAVSDVATDARFGRTFAQQTAYVPRAIVAVPLLDVEGTIGVLEVLDKRDMTPFTMRDIEVASIFAAQAAVAIRSSRVERETAHLMGSVLHGLLGSDAGPVSVDVLVAAAIAELSGDDEGRLWALVDQVARLRRIDPGQIALVTDIIDALVRQADRDRAADPRFRGR
ncbi:MAG: GAF domain-containing protein [Candidatus Limnocylindrales bacterium]